MSENGLQAPEEQRIAKVHTSTNVVVIESRGLAIGLNRGGTDQHSCPKISRDSTAEAGAAQIVFHFGQVPEVNRVTFRLQTDLRIAMRSVPARGQVERRPSSQLAD